MELTSGQARYLLAVSHLGLGARGVRCADIARMLDVTRPSVVKMLSFFSQRCLIARERYGKVYLTDTGCLLARCYARRLGRCPLLRQNCLDVKKCDNRPGLHIPLLYRA